MQRVSSSGCSWDRASGQRQQTYVSAMSERDSHALYVCMVECTGMPLPWLVCIIVISSVYSLEPIGKVMNRQTQYSRTCLKWLSTVTSDLAAR